MDPISMPGLKSGGGIGESAESFHDFYHDVKDYYNRDKPLIRRDGPAVGSKYSPIDTSWPYNKRLWKDHAHDGDTLPVMSEQTGPGGETSMIK